MNARSLVEAKNIGALDMARSTDHIARDFFNKYPRWEDFSHDLAMKRDHKEDEDEVLRQIDNLATLCGRESDDLRGQYAATQAGKPGAREDLIRCYHQAFQAHFHKSSGAYPPTDGGGPIGRHTR